MSIKQKTIKTPDVAAAIRYGRRGFRIELAAAALGTTPEKLREYETGARPIPQKFLNELLETAFSCLFFRLGLAQVVPDAAGAEKDIAAHFSPLTTNTNH